MDLVRFQAEGSGRGRMVSRGIRIQTFEKRLPRGMAAAYFATCGGKNLPTFVVNSRLTKARRREALRVILATACGLFDHVGISELAA